MIFLCDWYTYFLVYHIRNSKSRWMIKLRRVRCVTDEDNVVANLAFDYNDIFFNSLLL